MKSKCAECGGEIDVPDDVVPGEIVTCPDCGTDYEVKNIKSNIVTLKPAEMVGEDWGE